MKVHELVEMLLELDQDRDIFLNNDGDPEDLEIVEVSIWAIIRQGVVEYRDYNPGPSKGGEYGFSYIFGPYERARYLRSALGPTYTLQGRDIDERVLPGDPPVWLDDVRVRPDPTPGQLALPCLE